MVFSNSFLAAFSLLWSSFFVTLRAKKSYYDDAPFSNGIMLFFVLQRGFYSYCKNEVFYDCTLCKQILLLLYTKLLLSGIHADRSIHFLYCKSIEICQRLVLIVVTVVLRQLLSTEILQSLLFFMLRQTYLLRFLRH